MTKSCIVEGTMYHPLWVDGAVAPCKEVHSRGLCARHYYIAKRDGELATTGAPDARVNNGGRGKQRVERANHCSTCKCKAE